MAEEIKFEDIKEENISTELENLVGMIDGMGEDSLMPMMASLLSMPDEDFIQIGELILQELQKSLLNPSDRILLQKAMEEQGVTMESLSFLYSQVISELDNFQEEEGTELSKVKIDFIKRVFAIITNELIAATGEAGAIVNIPIELSEGAIKPLYAHTGDAAMDLFAIEDYEVKPGETVLVKTGVKVAIPNGYALLIQPRSGQSLKTKLRVANTPGLIDAPYRGEIGVIIENIEHPIKDIEYEFMGNGSSICIKSIEHGKSYTIEKGQRIAQMRLVEVPTVNWTETENIGEYESIRGEGGFGSTGI